MKQRDIKVNEWVQDLEELWGIDFDPNYFQAIVNDGYFIMKTSNGWNIVKQSGTNLNIQLDGVIGNITSMEVINDYMVSMNVTYKSGRTTIIRDYVLTYDDAKNYVKVDLIYNSTYTSYIKGRMDDIREQPNFEELCEEVGVSPEYDDVDIAAAFARRSYVFEYDTPQDDLAQAELIVEVDTGEEGVIKVDMALMMGDEELSPLNPLMSFMPNNDAQKDRWKGDIEFGTSMTIATDLRDRRSDALHLFAMSEEDLKYLLIECTCGYKEDDGDYVPFKVVFPIDATPYLEVFDYDGSTL